MATLMVSMDVPTPSTILVSSDQSGESKLLEVTTDCAVSRSPS